MESTKSKRSRRRCSLYFSDKKKWSLNSISTVVRTSTTYDERTWNKNEQNGILLHLLHVKYFMYIVQWSTKHHPSPSFFYYLYKKVLLCIAKCSIVEHSKVGFFFFMVSIEMVVDFLTSLHIEWRVQSTNVIQCLKSTHIHLHSFSTKTAGSWDVNRLDFKHCRLAIF